MIDINPSEQEPREVFNHPLTLRDFAKRQHMTEDRVWELIEEGELAARFVNDEIMLIREMEPELAEPAADLLNASAPEISVAVAAASFCSEQLTAELDQELDLEIESESIAQKHHNSGGNLDDHRELLLFAQDAMSRNMELSRQLLATKDELIRLKDEQIRQFQQRIEHQDRDARLLRRQIENLETLCKINTTP